MSQLVGFGLSRHWPQRPRRDGNAWILEQRPLDRILSHLRYSIDDVVNDPIAKHAVLGYFKLSRQVTRRCEIVDLERQWNPI
jgi:hypothetical protein